MCKVVFHDLKVDAVRPDELHPDQKGQIMAIRTDARHATRELKRNLTTHLSSDSVVSANFNDSALTGRIEKVLHEAYREWGHGVLEALSESVDYSKYGITDPDAEKLQVHFFNSNDLAGRAVRRALDMGRKASPHVEPMLISLDDLIHDNVIPIYEIAFSRLFSTDGKQQFDYVARPGYAPLEEQFQRIREEAARRHQQTGVKAPIVFIEDNVRFAKMLNWLFSEMDRNNIFDHADIVGISTCFCCAAEEERTNIKFKDQTVPVEAIIDYGATAVEVSTPRDLMFDGFVIEMGGKTMRLPGMFMDVVSRFKIRPDAIDQFRQDISRINVNFCKRLEDAFGIDVPLSWFAVAEPVANVTASSPMTPMSSIMRRAGDFDGQQPAFGPPGPPAMRLVANG